MLSLSFGDFDSYVCPSVIKTEVFRERDIAARIAAYAVEWEKSDDTQKQDSRNGVGRKGEQSIKVYN